MTAQHATKILFVCSRNRIRSLTAEKIMQGVSGFRVASAGTQPGARIVISVKIIRWADIVFCMEKSHLHKLRERYPEELDARQVIVLHIPDEYEFMAEDLVEELWSKLGEHLPLKRISNRTIL